MDRHISQYKEYVTTMWSQSKYSHTVSVQQIV